MPHCRMSVPCRTIPLSPVASSAGTAKLLLGTYSLSTGSREVRGLIQRERGRDSTSGISLPPVSLYKCTKEFSGVFPTGHNLPQQHLPRYVSLNAEDVPIRLGPSATVHIPPGCGHSSAQMQTVIDCAYARRRHVDGHRSTPGRLFDGVDSRGADQRLTILPRLISRALRPQNAKPGTRRLSSTRNELYRQHKNHIFKRIQAI